MNSTVTLPSNISLISLELTTPTFLTPPLLSLPPLSSSLQDYSTKGIHSDEIVEHNDLPYGQRTIFTHFIISVSQLVFILQENSEKALLYGLIGVCIGLILLMTFAIFLLHRRLKVIKSKSNNKKFHPFEVDLSSSKLNNKGQQKFVATSEGNNDLENNKQATFTVSHHSLKPNKNLNSERLRDVKTFPKSKPSMNSNFNEKFKNVHNINMNRAPSGGWTFHEGCPPQPTSPQSLASSPMLPGWGTNVFVHVESPNESPVLGSSIPKQQLTQQLFIQPNLSHPVELYQPHVQQYTIQRQQQHIMMQHTTINQCNSQQQLQQIPPIDKQLDHSKQITNKPDLKLIIPTTEQQSFLNCKPNHYKLNEASLGQLSHQKQQQQQLGQQFICESRPHQQQQQHSLHLQPQTSHKWQQLSERSSFLDNNEKRHSQEQNYLLPDSETQHHQQRQHQHLNSIEEGSCLHFYNQQVPIPYIHSNDKSIVNRHDDYYNMNPDNDVDNNNNDYINDINRKVNNTNNDKSIKNNVNIVSISNVDEYKDDSESIVWIRRSSIKLTTTDSEQLSSMLVGPSCSFNPPFLTLPPIKQPLEKQSPPNSSSSSNESSSPPTHSASPPDDSNQQIGARHGVNVVSEFKNLPVYKHANTVKLGRLSAKNNIDPAKINGKSLNSSPHLVSPIQYRILTHYPARHFSKKSHSINPNVSHSGKNEDDDSCEDDGTDNIC